MNWSLIEIIREGDMPQRLHGLAYRRYTPVGIEYVTALVPLNLIIGWVRWIWLRMAHDWTPPRDPRYKRCEWWPP
jgi:hypothetical protein